MCSIAGIVGQEVVSNIHRMVNVMNHRGPDEKGIWIDDNITLGHCRLSILDLSPMGHQPMQSFCGRYWITYNGEVYNFKELKEKLQKSGIVFHSETDTEVIVNLFSVYGEFSFTMLRGMFALGIWDTKAKELWLARDPMGIKPLLYCSREGKFAFASEMKGLLASGISNRNYDSNSIIEFLSQGHILQPNTIFEDVKMLRPGHRMKVRLHQTETAKFWDFPKNNSNELKNISLTEAVSEVRRLVVSSVEEELVSDVPLGLFLSGGLDSSILATVMQKICNQNVKSFSLGFGEEGKSINETGLAAETAKYLGCVHENYIVGSKELRDNFDHFIFSLDQPSIDGLNTYFISQKTKQKVTVALSGLGGDEVFSGYGWVKKLMKLTKGSDSLLNYYIKIRKDIPAKLKGITDNWAARNSLSLTYALTNSIFFPVQLEQFNYTFNRNTKNILRIIDEGQAGIENNLSRINQILIYDIRRFMGSRLLRDSDCVSMAHSLEVRFPLIDIRLVEFVMSLPAKLRVDERFLASKGKYENDFNFEEHGIKKLLFEAFRKDLDPNFGKRKKTGFKLPMNNWLKNDLREIMTDYLLQPSPFFENSIGEIILREFEEGKKSWVHPWALIVLNAYDRQLKSTENQ